MCGGGWCLIVVTGDNGTDNLIKLFCQVDDAWKSSSWAKRLELKAKRGGLNDFDRFKLRKAKSARNKIVAKALNTKKKQLRKAGKL